MRPGMRGTVLFIHGAFIGSWCWAGWRQAFARAGFRTQAPDLRHHGAAEAGDQRLGRVGLEDYVADLAQAIAADGEIPIVVGHSMGGLIAQLLAARGLARAAVLLAPARPWGIPPTGPYELGSAASLARIRNYWQRPIRPDFATAAAYALEHLPAAAQRKAYAGFVPESGRALFEMLHWPFDWSMAARVEPWKVRCPVLAVAGGRDRMIPPSSVRLIAAAYGATYEEAPAHGHWLIGEPGWQRLAARCLAWIRDMDRTAKAG